MGDDKNRAAEGGGEVFIPFVTSQRLNVDFVSVNDAVDDPCI